jgi:hypothetical protein
MLCRVTVDQLPTDVLPDDVLLEISAFYVGETQDIDDNRWCTCVNDGKTSYLDRQVA